MPGHAGAAEWRAAALRHAGMCGPFGNSAMPCVRARGRATIGAKAHRRHASAQSVDCMAADMGGAVLEGAASAPMNCARRASERGTRMTWMRQQRHSAIMAMRRRPYQGDAPLLVCVLQVCRPGQFCASPDIYTRMRSLIFSISASSLSNLASTNSRKVTV